MSLVSRVQNILISPQNEWPVIASEGASVGSLYTGYFIPLAAFKAVCSIIGTIILLGSAGLVLGLISGVIGLAVDLGLLFVVGLIAGKLAPSFGGRDDLTQGLKLVGYAGTSVWVIGGIGALIPFVGWLIGLLALIYGLYLLYLGVAPVMGVPADKTIVYTLVLVVIEFVVYFVAGLIVATISAIFVGGAMLAAAH